MYLTWMFPRGRYVRDPFRKASQILLGRAVRWCTLFDGYKLPLPELAPYTERGYPIDPCFL